MINRLERLALQRHLRVGPHRRIILQILDKARDPLSARQIYQRAQATDRPISLPTIQRTLSALTAAGLLRAVRSPGRQKRYEQTAPERREHLIDTSTGERIEFRSEGIEGLLKYAVHQLGYRLLDYHVELFGRPDRAAGRRPRRRERH